MAIAIVSTLGSAFRGLQMVCLCGQMASPVSILPQLIVHSYVLVLLQLVKTSGVYYCRSALWFSNLLQLLQHCSHEVLM